MSGHAHAQAADSALVAWARAIHDRVITLDTHVDINPGNFTPARNYTQRLSTQVDLPKMEEGGLDAVFLIVYVGENSDLTPDGFARAHAAALEKFTAIHRLTKELAPDRIGLALTAADVRRIAATGRKVALIGVGDSATRAAYQGELQEINRRSPPIGRRTSPSSGRGICFGSWRPSSA
ncbi:MAG: membrane dipeptidase [Gemmatimonadales bacterium]